MSDIHLFSEIDVPSSYRVPNCSISMADEKNVGETNFLSSIIQVTTGFQIRNIKRNFKKVKSNL